MDRSNNQTFNSPTNKRLVSTIRKHYPNLNEKEMSSVLTSIKKFVVLVQRLRTEPQAQIIYKERKTGGKIHKQRVIKTEHEEIIKVMDKPHQSISEVMEAFSKRFPEKHGRRPKKV